MKRVLLATSAFVLVASAQGCFKEIQPQGPVITRPDMRDFGFAGVWQLVPDPLVDKKPEAEPVTVASAPDGSYKVDAKAFGEHSVILRGVPLDEDSGRVIVEIEISDGAKTTVRFLSIFKRTAGELDVWPIEGTNLAKLMADDGYAAVIEHSAFSTKVYAKSEQLIDCIRKHPAQLVGKPTSYRRMAK